MNKPDGVFIDNPHARRFEYAVGGHAAIADYSREEDVVTLIRVFAPDELRGTGAAGTLMTHIAESARAQGFKIYPVCSYAVAWLNKNPDYKDIVK